MPIIGFLLMIIVTALLLKLPICHKGQLNWIDAFFEAASVVSATGSNVVEVAEKFTWVGQLVMMVAMEVGAVGFMMFFSVLLKKCLIIFPNIFKFFYPYT